MQLAAASRRGPLTRGWSMVASFRYEAARMAHQTQGGSRTESFGANNQMCVPPRKLVLEAPIVRVQSLLT